MARFRRLSRFALAGLATLATADARAQMNEQCDPSQYELLPNGRPAWTEGVEQLTWYNAGDARYDPAILEGTRVFELTYGIQVKVVGIPEADFVANAARSLATGDDTYDNFDMLPAIPMPTWVERGWVAPVDCAVPAWLAEQWPQGIWEASEYEGKHYFVPHASQPLVFLWNKKMFEEAGLDPNAPPQSWEELAAYAKELTRDENGDGNIDQWGFVFPLGKLDRTPILTYSFFLGMNGTRLWNEDGSAAFDSPEGVEAMQFMVDLVQEHQVSPESVINYATTEVSDVFRSGGAAMAMHFVGHPVIADIEQLGEETVGAAPPPPATPDTEALYPLGFIGLGQYVNANSQHLVAATHLAAFMGTYQQSWREALFESNVGSNLHIWESPYLTERYPIGDAVRGILERGYMPTHRGLLVAMTVFEQGIDSAVTGERSAQEAVDFIVATLKDRDVLE